MNNEAQSQEGQMPIDLLLEMKFKQLLDDNCFPGYSANLGYPGGIWKKEIYYKSLTELSKVNAHMHVLRTKRFGFIRALFWKYLKNGYIHYIGDISFYDGACSIKYSCKEYQLLLERIVGDIHKNLECEVKLVFDPNKDLGPESFDPSP